MHNTACNTAHETGTVKVRGEHARIPQQAHTARQAFSQMQCGLTRGAAVLAAILLVTACAVPACYAHYTSNAAGLAEARIAEFAVNSTSTLDKTLSFELAPGDYQELDVSLSNEGDVAARHEITFTVYGDLPLTIQATDAAILAGATPVDDAVADTFVWTCETAPGQGQLTLKFELVWPSELDDPIYATGASTVQIHVLSTQID